MKSSICKRKKDPRQCCAGDFLREELSGRSLSPAVNCRVWLPAGQARGHHWPDKWHPHPLGQDRAHAITWHMWGMAERWQCWERTRAWGRMQGDTIKAMGNVVRVWDGWWGGVEQEYRTQFHSKLGFINNAALRTACFLTCKESVKCCLFFSLRLFSSLLCSFLYCHPMLWLWFSALSHNISTAALYFEMSSHQH